MTNAERQRKYRSANLELVRERERLSKLWTKYGVTPEAWQAMFKKQDGCCAGCGESFKFTKPCVDHDRVTMKFRGLLCHACNRGLGLLKERVEVLIRLASYLTR